MVKKFTIYEMIRDRRACGDVISDDSEDSEYD